ncbi:hypothetical protein, partial [Burkholderia ubonensis]|uniref:hypothetical protein n=1 Tax=Burkholderia ubonensis TaxID=101571 RepID=UPI001C52FD84
PSSARHGAPSCAAVQISISFLTFSIPFLYVDSPPEWHRKREHSTPHGKGPGMTKLRSETTY